MTNEYSVRKFMNNPWLILLMIGIGAYIGKLWRDDRRHPHDRALPGATPASSRAVFIAIAGALVLLAVETAGEKSLGLADQQSSMTWLFALYSMAVAPILEELIFRGYLVIANQGKTVLWLGVFVTSLAFALLHGYLWHRDDAGFTLALTAKGGFSTAILFAFSLWLYVARFAPWNSAHSLLPCFAAHAAKNIGVVLIKAATGHMVGLW